MAMKGQVVAAALLLVGLWPTLSTAEWGKPLGGAYDGPEGKPRVVAPSIVELGADERATMAVFERATKSVVFIANTAIQRELVAAEHVLPHERDPLATETADPAGLRPPLHTQRCLRPHDVKARFGSRFGSRFVHVAHCAAPVAQSECAVDRLPSQA